MATLLRCRKCGTEFTRPVERGRVPAYCSTGCRRAAEREIRRADSALATVEDRLRWGRINADHEPRLARRYEAERVRLERRLAELLDDDVKA